MSRIYNLARDMVIWLGVEKDGSANAMDTIQRVASEGNVYIRKANSDQWTRYPRHTLGPKLEFEVQFSVEDITNLWNLLRRPYWSRLWIIQKIMYARHIRLKCGNNGIPWTSLEIFCRKVWYADIPYAHAEIPETVSYLTRRKGIWDQGRAWKPDSHGVFLDIVLDSYYFKCENVLDKVYGMLGLVTTNENKKPEVDYDQTPLDLFLKIMKGSISQYGISKEAEVGLLLWYLLFPRRHVSYVSDGSTVLYKGIGEYASFKIQDLGSLYNSMFSESGIFGCVEDHAILEIELVAKTLEMLKEPNLSAAGLDRVRNLVLERLLSSLESPGERVWFTNAWGSSG